MANATRFGFEHGSTGPLPLLDGAVPDRGAQTLFGRDVHLRVPAGEEALPVPAAAPGEAPSPAVESAPAAVEPAAEQARHPTPSHTGKSRFPALARVLRWNTGGQLV